MSLKANIFIHSKWIGVWQFHKKNGVTSCNAMGQTEKAKCYRNCDHFYSMFQLNKCPRCMPWEKKLYTNNNNNKQLLRHAFVACDFIVDTYAYESFVSPVYIHIVVYAAILLGINGGYMCVSVPSCLWDFFVFIFLLCFFFRKLSAYWYTLRIGQSSF